MSEQIPEPSRLPRPEPTPGPGQGNAESGEGRRGWWSFLRRRRPVIVPVVRLTGVIGGGGLRSGLTLAGLASDLHRAFSMRGPVVALQINSPGGSPVQSSLIAGRIRDLAQEKRKHVLAFVEDVGASGGYWIAVAADEVFVDSSSIVGSVGVVTAGFGFDRLIERHGIDRRVHTAGRSKFMLDPFRPERPEDVARLRQIQDELHGRFIAWVRERRQGRLVDAGDGDLFDGRIWSGEEALRLGLVDGVGHLRPVLRARYGRDVQLRPVMRRPGLLARLRGRRTEEAPGLELVRGVIEAVEERAIWQRFGL